MHVNHGLMRKGESEQVVDVFQNQLDANLVYVDATDRFLSLLDGVEEPEAKRKIIGAEFIRVFEEEARKGGRRGELPGAGHHLPRYPESDGVKAHHNVGGLPDDLQFELCEPVKLLYKDEVRVIGRELGLPEGMVERQPFPGPGLGVRCLGAITRDRLEALREADAILRDEFAAAGLEGKVWQYFVTVPDFRATGVRDGVRAFEVAGDHPRGQHGGCHDRRGAGAGLVAAQEDHHADSGRGPRHLPRMLRPDPKPIGTIEWE